MDYTVVLLCSFYEHSSLDYCCSKWDNRVTCGVSILADQSIYVSVSVCISYFLYIWIMLDLGQKTDWLSLKCQVMAFSRRVCVPAETTPPFPILNLPLPPPFSHHNIVFISPLRLNPSLPVHRGKRHFENEIGYINSSTITLAIAFPFYSSSETWLTSTPTPTFLTKRKGKRQQMGSALSADSNWEQWGEGKREDYLLYILIHSWQKVSSNYLLSPLETRAISV